MVVNLRGRKAPPEYCTVYHCAGDCGKPHNQNEMVLFYFDQQRREAQAPLRELRAQVRRNAKDRL